MPNLAYVPEKGTPDGVWVRPSPNYLGTLAKTYETWLDPDLGRAFSRNTWHIELIHRAAYALAFQDPVAAHRVLYTIDEYSGHQGCFWPVTIVEELDEVVKNPRVGSQRWLAWAGGVAAACSQRGSLGDTVAMVSDPDRLEASLAWQCQLENQNEMFAEIQSSTDMFYSLLTSDKTCLAGSWSGGVTERTSMTERVLGGFGDKTEKEGMWRQATLSQGDVFHVRTANPKAVELFNSWLQQGKPTFMFDTWFFARVHNLGPVNGKNEVAKTALDLTDQWRGTRESLIELSSLAVESSQKTSNAVVRLVNAAAKSHTLDTPQEILAAGDKIACRGEDAVLVAEKLAESWDGSLSDLAEMTCSLLDHP